MNWGHRIAILYSLFVIFMITLVTLCVKQKDVTLVSEDYYKKELAYQDEIEKQRNTDKLLTPVTIQYVSTIKTVVITFPDTLRGAIGKIQFYRPSDAKKDIIVALKIAASVTQEIPVGQLSRGLWVVKIEWQKDGKGYLKEEKITL